MTTPNIEELRRLAQAATPGIWCHVQRGISRWHGERIEADLNPICDFAMLQDCCVHEYDRAYENAAYIQAANPAAIIGLIDTIQSQAERIKALELDLDVQAGSIEAVKAVNARQAERIKELEAEIITRTSYGDEQTDFAIKLAAARDALRAELDAIAATEPVASHYFDIEGNLYTANRAKFLRPSLNGLTPLFTRPMPAQDVTELVEALEKLARLGNGDQYGNSDGNMIARTALSKYKGAK